MRQALVIFRKDVRHLWPVGLMMSGLVAVQGWFDVRVEQNYISALHGPLSDFVGPLLFLACWCIVAILVQQERTADDRQYWRSRPISPGAVLAAKALFLATFISAPSLLTQTAVLISTGYPPDRYLAPLLWNQALLLPFLSIAAGFAAITRNFREYVLTTLAAFAAGLLVQVPFAANEVTFQLDSFGWARNAAGGLIVLMAMAAVLTVQYTAPRAALAWAIGGAGIVLSFIPTLGNVGWQQAFDLTSAVSGSPDAATRQVRIDFDRAAKPALGTLPLEFGGTRVRLAIPVQITGIPSGRQLLSKRVSITIQAPGARAWGSGWRRTNELAARTKWRDIPDWLAADGSYWLAFSVPVAYVDDAQDRPSSVRAEIALSEFAAPVTTKFPVRPAEYRLPEVTQCSLNSARSYTTVNCVTPFAYHVTTGFRIQSHLGVVTEELPGWGAASYAPVSFHSSFTAWASVGFSFGPQELSTDDYILVDMRRPLSHFKRAIKIDAVQLGRYEVGRQ